MGRNQGPTDHPRVINRVFLRKNRRVLRNRFQGHTEKHFLRLIFQDLRTKNHGFEKKKIKIWLKILDSKIKGSKFLDLLRKKLQGPSGQKSCCFFINESDHKSKILRKNIEEPYNQKS